MGNDFLSQEEVDKLLKGVGFIDDLPPFTLNTAIIKIKEDITSIKSKVVKLKIKLHIYQDILKMLECIDD